jgi:RimJ/RimL family protein N-acetyltransferase
MTVPISKGAVTLRPARPDDEPFLAAVYGSTREQELAMTPWTAEQRQAFIKFQFDAQSAHYRTEYPEAEQSIIMLGDRPVGRIYLDRRESEIRILDITVLTQYRGQGIGTPIIRDVMEEAARAGKTVSINLDSFSQSHQLFARLGFKSTETTSFHTLYVWNPKVPQVVQPAEAPAG